VSKLARNGQRVELEGNSGGVSGKQYAPDLVEASQAAFAPLPRP
jgi:hypothetical protein